MRRPMHRGAPVDMARMSSWRAPFSGYRHSVTEARIERWLDQFNPEHRDIAARLLDAVEYVPHEQITSAFRSLLSGLSGWSERLHKRRGRWRFVAFSVSAGESGDSMLHRFRSANGLNQKRDNELFVHKSQLVGEQLGPEDTVVFVDDFAGTGNQACDAWQENIKELMPGAPHAVLLLVSASVGARRRIEGETDLAVVTQFDLTECDNIFSRECKHFTKREKSILLNYCKKADPRQPRGYEDCGFVIVFAHTCPNNSIPILHVHHQKWEGLFTRYD